MIKRAISVTLLFAATAQWHCIQAYISPYKAPPSGYLVVDGYISSNAPSYFVLSRSISLPGDSTIPRVTGADLQLEGTDGSVNPFADSGNGVYWLPPVAMNTATQYRVRISNVNNETYLSAWAPYKPTPAIDSVNWTSNSAGVNIYVNTHDPTGNTRYYRWKYVETWELNSGEQSGYIYTDSGIIPRPPADQIFTCWHNDSATTLVIGSTASLAQDVVYEQPIVSIPVNTYALSIEYSILVNEYALTDSAYQYLSLMKTTTEQLGSIFDAQPTQLTGNIHSLSNPSEPVLGYISAGTLQQERIFITRAQVPNWLYFFDCMFPDIIVSGTSDSLTFYFGRGVYTPVATSGISNYTANYTSCVDCRTQGNSSTQKPSWWP